MAVFIGDVMDGKKNTLLPTPPPAAPLPPI